MSGWRKRELRLLKQTLARVYSAVLNRPEGYVDVVENNVVKGWAFDPSAPSRTVEVELLVDGQPAGAFAANRFRADLNQAGKGDGHHGFEIPVPGAALDGKPHQISVRMVGGRMLAGSPKRMEGATAIAAHAQARPHLVRGTANPGLPPPELASLQVDPRRHGKALPPISAILATYNRGAFMEETLRQHIACAEGLEVEFLVIDDGSADDTPQRLAALAREFPHVRYERVPNGGAGQARNIGCAMAKHDLILFLGDDIRPAARDYYFQHMRAHCWMPDPEVAILGKIVWPNTVDERVNFVMSHVQGVGQEQFGFFAILPYTWLDWRFFYTSNVSFKKNVVADWSKEGFSREFPIYGYEDIEFAYRVHKKLGNKFRILYTPGPVATHHHNYTVQQFIDRQIRAGMMARVFVRLHPEVANDVGILQIESALETPGGVNEPVDEYLSMIEGIKSWAKVIDRHYNLGSQNWHHDFLSSVFELCYLQGCIMGCGRPEANYGAAYRFVLERFQERFASAVSFEALGRLLRIPVV